MSERRAMIDQAKPLPVVRQCKLVDLARSTAYYRPAPVSAADLRVMRLIDEIHLRLPFYGSRRIRDELEDGGERVNRKRIQRLAEHKLSLAKSAENLQKRKAFTPI